MKKAIIYSGVLISIASFAMSVGATTTPADFNKQRTGERMEFNEQKRALLRDTRLDIKNTRLNTATTVRAEFLKAHNKLMEKRKLLKTASSSEDRLNILKEIRETRADRSEQIQEIRKEGQDEMRDIRKAAIAKMETERKALREKLSKIKDEAKKALVERMNSRFSEIQDRIIASFTVILDRLEDVVDKVQDRVDTAIAGGKNVGDAQKSLDEARNLITKARDMLKAVAAQTYPIAVTTEDKLGASVSGSRNQFHSDLSAVRDVVRDARKAVQDAISALGSVQPSTPTATSTASSTAQ